MKKTTKFLLPLLVALSLLVAPAIAFAGTGPVHRALAGGLIDPAGTTMRVVPPKGGMVLVYRNGKAVGWLMRAGYLNLKPNRIYGVVATRGTSVLFNAGLMLRPGLTELVWRGDSQPQISYLPAFQPYQNHRAASQVGVGYVGGQQGHHDAGRQGRHATTSRPYAATRKATHRSTASKLRGTKNRARLRSLRGVRASDKALLHKRLDKRLVSRMRAGAPGLSAHKVSRASR